MNFQGRLQGIKQRLRGAWDNAGPRLQNADAAFAALAAETRHRAQVAGVERNRAFLSEGSTEEIMRRLIAERQIAKGSPEEAAHRFHARGAAYSSTREPLMGYAETMNRGPGGLTNQGIGEAIAHKLSQSRPARIGFAYAPAALVGAGALTQAGGALMGLGQQREADLFTLADLEVAAAERRKELQAELRAAERGQG
jgi:hypothetical protein